MRLFTSAGLIFLASCVVCLTLGNPPAHAGGPGKDAPQQSFVIPFTPLVHHGAPVIMVRLNDGEEAPFMIDTGADSCLMTEAYAKKMGFKLEDTRRTELLNYGTLEKPKEAVIDDVKMGTLDLGPGRFIVLHGLNLLTKGDTPVCGMIGLSFLSHFGVFLDYQHHVMALIYPGKLSDADVKKLGFADPAAIRAPLEKRLLSYDHGGGILYRDTEYSTVITLKNGDKTATVKPTVDTGAPNSSIGRKPAMTLKMSEDDVARSWTHATGSADLSRGTVQELKVGGVSVAGERLDFPGSNGQGEGFPELLGADVLSYCNVLFDYPNNALYLRPVLPPLAAPLAAKDASAERLRAAAVSPGINVSIEDGGETNFPDESDTDVEEQVVALKAALATASANPIDDARQWDALGSARRRLGWDAKETEEAFANATRLYRAALPTIEAIADPVARHTAMDEAAKAFGDAGAYDDAIRLARRAAESAAPGEWRPYVALGAMQHRKAAHLLNERDNFVWDDAPFDDDRFWRLRQRFHATPPPQSTLETVRELNDEAKDSFDKAVAVAPNSADALLIRAHYRSAQGLDIAAPLEALHKADPDLSKLEFDYGVRDDVIKASKLKPNDPDLIARVALLEINCTNAQDAKDIGYRDQRLWDLLPVRTRTAAEVQVSQLEALAADSSDKFRAARARARLGCLDMQYLSPEGDTADAEDALKTSISQNAKDTLPLRALYLICAEQRRYADILPILKAYAPAQGNALGYLMLAHAEEATEDAAAALTAIDKALALAPHDLDANLYKADLLLRSPDSTDQAARLSQALACLETAKAMLLPGDRYSKYAIQDAYAIYYGLAGQPEKAQDEAMKTLNEDRAETQAREILAAFSH